MAAHDQQLYELLDIMDENVSPTVSGDKSRRTIEFIASLYESASTDRTVRCGDLTPDDPFYYSNNGIKL